MKLVEKHVVKRGSPMFAEIDELAFRSKNLYNRANYSIRQTFFERGVILNYETLDKLLQSEESYQALPRKVSQQILMVLARNWKAWNAATIEYAKYPYSFLGKPKLPKYKHKTDGRNLLIYTIQAIGKPGLKVGVLRPSQTNLSITTLVSDINQVRIVPRLKHYVIEVVYARSCATTNNLDPTRIAAIDIGVDNRSGCNFKP